MTVSDILLLRVSGLKGRLAAVLEDGRVQKEMKRGEQQRFECGTSELHTSFVLSSPCALGPELTMKMSMVTMREHRRDRSAMSFG